MCSGLFLLFVLLVRTCRADNPVGRLYGHNLRITQLADEARNPTDQYNIRMNLLVFQAGDYVLDISEVQRQEAINVYEGTLPSWRLLLAQRQAQDNIYGDDELNPEFAMMNSINMLTKRFQVLQGTMFAALNGTEFRRDYIIKDAAYDTDSNELRVTVEYTDGNRTLLDMQDWWAANDLPADGLGSAKNSKPKQRSDCKAGKDPEDNAYDCAKLASMLEWYEAVVEIRPSLVRARPKSTSEKLAECNADRIVEMSCTGPNCVEALSASGVESGWQMGTTSYRNLVTGDKCCNLMRLCEGLMAGKQANCQLKDDVQGVTPMWAMSAGNAWLGTGNEVWQAQCQPECPVDAKEALQPWGICRWNRQRCKDNCRCSWWC